MAHKKGEGSTQNGRDSNPKHLGVKLYGGEAALAGNIIIRQRGTKYHPGENVYMGKDYTIHARVDGTVQFKKGRRNRTFVHIMPFGEVPETPDRKPKKIPLTKPTNTDTAKDPVRKEAPAPQKVAEKPAETTKSEKITLPSGKKLVQDDLKMVEGIGPKIEGLLNEAGIVTWKDLATAPQDKVQAILDEAGPRYRMHQPATWAKQAELADAGNWELLEKYQDWLDGGREPEGETFDFGGGDSSAKAAADEEE